MVCILALSLQIKGKNSEIDDVYSVSDVELTGEDGGNILYGR